MRLIYRLVCRLANQDTARANAARASTALRERRDEQEGVEAYLRTRDGTLRPGHPTSGAVARTNP